MNIHRAFRPRRNSISGGIIGRCPTQSAERAATRRDPLLLSLSLSLPPRTSWFHFPLSPRSDLPANFLGLANLEYDLRKKLDGKIVRTIKYRKNWKGNSFGTEDAFLRNVSLYTLRERLFFKSSINFEFDFPKYYLIHWLKINRDTARNLIRLKGEKIS